MLKLLATTLLLLAVKTTAFSATAGTGPKDALAKLVVENLKADTDKLSPKLQEERQQAFSFLVGTAVS